MKFLKIFFIFSLLTFISSCQSFNIFSSNYQEPKYVEGTEDIPLFKGLKLISDESTTFDTISGNIVVSKYIGDFEMAEIEEFYTKTLPQLGWKLDYQDNKKISFKRNQDRLEIDLEYASRGLYVAFFISLIVG